MSEIKAFWFCSHCRHFKYDTYNGEWYCAAREEKLKQILLMEAKEYVEARKNEE
jgi:frataxin-like iron-binding protein CyaY